MSVLFAEGWCNAFMGSGPFMPEAQVTVFNKLGLLHFIARFFCR